MAKESKISRKDQAQKTRQKIYDSAAKLFLQQGFETVTVDEIVQDAGVAKGSFYVHFESKDELIVLLINEYVKKVDSEYQAFLSSLFEDMSTEDKFLSLVAKIADVLVDQIGSEQMRFLYRIQLDKKLNVESVMSYDRDLHKMFLMLIEDGFKTGAFDSSLSAEKVTRQFVMAYRGLSYEWCIRAPEFDLKAESLSLFEILLRGLKA